MHHAILLSLTNHAFFAQLVLPTQAWTRPGLHQSTWANYRIDHNTERALYLAQAQL